ncbi:probable ATP-dependent RNA helicase DDX10 [Tribolium castaneum]|uniref:probable ATP-dependent RNA helicase DDX10 n=1 Tax=Tribolium castaneum TaxID=7070 RepID=UPI00046BF88F|nr:PREDICTED: probable ATP-dependent RNA helicase DDX10 [Tribolium castaneum]|eukprot:XP_968425.2 PREDICTED: probable ATP-dependent RNA helicase DDX10 [Tribolium castaneum]
MFVKHANLAFTCVLFALISIMSKKPPKQSNKSKGKAKIKIFNNRKKATTPESAAIEKLQEKYEAIDVSTINSFDDLPLSPKTLKGLKECGYTKPTDIQRETIKLGLTGKDILGAAQTGSGKTLAFLIPILERLYCKQWTRLDGLGALVITPTRELAYQIFEELRRVGEHHEFSAGLIIGGKDLKFERNRMDQCNIVIGTPGRILQHMDENPLFDCVNMEILVLDEADRCLDMGFEQTMNAIVANLPAKRQTLLFSATQTKSVRDLARLSLKNPAYVSVHEHSEYSTPKGLQQSYVVCELKDKVSILWSFIKNHLKQKSIIFLASCKEVKYVYEIFCRLRPGVSLMALYGTLHQLRRMDIYENFCKKTSAVLFATDIAARGLDFPEVHWVVQADCPEDAATYIHRVGRTARFFRGGESLLLLLPSELKMLDNLKEKKIPIEKIDINPLKLNNPVRKMEAFLARDPDLKDTAQRAFVSYAKSVFLMKDKKVFNVQALDTDSFAHSLGLAIPPRIRFLQRLNARNAKIQQSKNKIYFNDEDEEKKIETAVSTDSGVSDDEKPSAPFHVSDDSDSDDGVLKVKRKDHDIDLPTDFELEENSKNKNKKPVTKAAVAKKLLKKKIVPNKKIVFDDSGEAVTVGLKDKKSQLAKEYENEDKGGIDIETAKLVLKEEDKFDKQLFKDKVKAKHKEEKRKLKELKKEEEAEKDEFGESESENEPDLSWLPDPDKIYGKGEQEELTEETIKPKKRKLKSGDTNKELPVKKKRKKGKISKISSNLDVNEAEELALMLLRNK